MTYRDGIADAIIELDALHIKGKLMTPTKRIRRSSRKLPPDDVIRQDKLNGMTVKDMAAKYGVTPSAVSKHVNTKIFIKPVQDAGIILAGQVIDPCPRKIVNERGHSLPRVVCVYGEYMPRAVQENRA